MGRAKGIGSGGAGGNGADPDLATIARTLEEAARLLARLAQEQSEPVEPVRRPARGKVAFGAFHVRAIIAARRLRSAYLPDLSGDHAFAMLLELYAARLEGRRIAQTRLGSAAGVPHATAIRILQALQDDGLVATSGDPADRRLSLVGLTDEAAAKIEAYLTAALAAMPGLV